MRARSGQCIKEQYNRYAIRTAESEGKVWAMYSSITVGYAIRTAESEQHRSVWAMYKKSSITVGYAIRTAESEGKVCAMYKKSSITVGYC